MNNRIKYAVYLRIAAYGVFLILGMIAISVHFDNLDAAMNKTAAMAEQPIGDPWKAYADALIDAAKAQGELNDRLKSISNP
jgi:hypothetical protein